MATRCLVADDSSTMRKIILRSLNAVGVNDITVYGWDQTILYRTVVAS